MFPRTGTIVGFRPIVESTMISFHHVWGDMGARQYRFIHAVEGYGKAILRSHQLDPADTMILFSHSGVNAGDPRYRARRQGNRHEGHRGDLAAAFLRDGLAPFLGQATVRSRRCRYRHRRAARRRLDPHRRARSACRANSTSITIAIAHAIVSATAEKLVERGVTAVRDGQPQHRRQGGRQRAERSQLR